MDSDSDGITYISGNSVYHAKGPDLSNLRNMNNSNFLQSTMTLPRNFEKQFRNMEPNYMQHNMCYRRETSPMSMHSFRHQPRNFSTYNRSHQVMSSNRGGYSMSVRSIDSTATVNAVDIITAIKGAELDSNALNSIIDSCKFMKKFKRQERMRQHHLFRRRQRYESDDDSSKASDSSSSGGASTCTRRKSILAGYNRKFCKDYDSRSITSNMTDRGNTYKKTSMISNFRFNGSEQKLATDKRKTSKKTSMISNFRFNGSEQKLATDKRKTSKKTSMISNFRFNGLEKQIETAKNENDVFIFNSKTDIKNPPVFPKYRFKNSFLLPSQRFNKNTASDTVEEETDDRDDKMFTKPQQPQITLKTNTEYNVDTDCDEIFYEIKGKHNHKPLKDMGKRNLCDSNDPLGGDKKRIKIDTEKFVNAAETLDEKENDFTFAKPKVPLKKNSKVKEILISKFAQPIIDNLSPIKNRNGDSDNMTKHGNTSENDVSTVTQNNTTSEVTMRPSFMKRKLFTQTLDITETKNLSSDDMHSPQPNVYKEINKEKNKSRRLVSGQSCLLRDVGQDDNTLINLIQTIVPSDQINLTQASNKSVLKTKKAKTSNKKNSKGPEKDWDLISLISTCEDGNISDTYTDEEIFNNTSTVDKTADKTKGKKMLNKYNIKQCRVVLENHTTESVYKTSNVDLNPQIKNQQTKNDIKKKVDKLEQNIFNEIEHMDKEKRNDETILSPRTLRKQQRCIAKPIATSLQNTGEKTKIDEKVQLNVSSIPKGVNTDNKSGAVVQQKKNIAQIVEAFWNSELDSDVETGGYQGKRVHPIVTEKSFEKPNKCASLTKHSNTPQVTKPQKCSVIKTPNAKTSVKQVSVGKPLQQLNDKQSNKQAIAPKQKVCRKKNVDDTLIEQATVGCSVRTRRNHNLCLSDNSLNSPNFNLHIGNNGANKRSKRSVTAVAKRVNNQETKSTLKRNNCKLNGKTKPFDLNNSPVKQIGKSICKEKCSHSQELVKDNENLKSRDKKYIKSNARENNSTKYRKKGKKISKSNDQNNDFNITIKSLRSSDDSFRFNKKRTRK